MVELLERSSGNILGFQMSGRLHDQDYAQFVPVIEAAIDEYGKVRLLAQFHDFHGWTAHALWDDIKFSSRHCTEVERIAIVGDKLWEYWMSSVCKPFTKAKVQYFDVLECDEAWSWLSSS